MINKFNEAEKNCVMLNYFDKETLGKKPKFFSQAYTGEEFSSPRETIKIISIENPKKCITKISDEKDMVLNKLTNGEIMINIIINYAKDNGFKNIILDDDSKFYCLDSKQEYKYDLRHVLAVG